jgi:hypothetical protein
MDSKRQYSTLNHYGVHEDNLLQDKNQFTDALFPQLTEIYGTYRRALNLMD